MTASPTIDDQRRHAPATERNRDAILAILAKILPAHGTILEIASGSGEHVQHFAEALPALRWQPSDIDPAARASIAAWTADTDLANIEPPLALDAVAPNWPIDRADAVISINMVHISPWAAAIGLLSGAARLLPEGAPLYLYGPYRRAGLELVASNAAFDEDLRRRNPVWGLRSLEALTEAADAAGFDRDEPIEMPANNLSLVFRRR
ncbi:MAG TPA: DUF938 domain-containing protein [Aliidongia sp.]|nr:DUF938 domain-containing protein [Aliidongia sp.]